MCATSYGPVSKSNHQSCHKSCICGTAATTIRDTADLNWRKKIHCRVSPHSCVVYDTGWPRSIPAYYPAPSYWGRNGLDSDDNMDNYARWWFYWRHADLSTIFHTFLDTRQHDLFQCIGILQCIFSLFQPQSFPLITLETIENIYHVFFEEMESGGQF